LVLAVSETNTARTGAGETFGGSAKLRMLTLEVLWRFLIEGAAGGSLPLARGL